MVKQFTREEFLRNLEDSGLLSSSEISEALASQRQDASEGEEAAKCLVRAGKLTVYQAAAVLERDFKRLTIGNYQILDRLGAGGMGTVYKARHRRMKRVVAIKVLSREMGQNQKFVERFQREVEAVARLSHPNIVMAHDADEAEAGHFLVMEFVDGKDLASLVNDGGPMSIPDAVACILQAAAGLDYSHKQGIIHRDIKPANLLRDAAGMVKVADLGLARFNDNLSTPEESGALTQAGSIMGTVDYMPPEQAMGLKGIDHRADIYSLGCSLYYLLTGKPPYQGPSLMATLLLHQKGVIPSLRSVRPDVSFALDQVFQRMVAKDPQNRFESMTEVIEALTAVQMTFATEAADSFSLGGLPSSDQTVDFSPANQDTDATRIFVEPEVAEPEAALLTALLVEPSRSQAMIIRGYLHKLGYQNVAAAHSGQEALDSAHERHPHVVLSAMYLPDMTGMQLAQKIRTDLSLRSTAFVLITSQADAHEVDLHSQQCQAVWLIKPFGVEQLGQALEAACRAFRQDGERTSAAPQRELRVLLVDDSSAARSHERKVLAALGCHNVIEAADGVEAVAWLNREPFDLVVTDYVMPRLDGFGLVDYIRHQCSRPSLPVVLVTTETDPAKLDPIRQLGVLAIFDKKFDPAQVGPILETIRYD